MSIEFKHGFPYQQPTSKSGLDKAQDAYMKYAQMANYQKAQTEQDNMEKFEEAVGKLFTQGSYVKNQFTNIDGNISRSGVDSFPDRKTARANYEYLAKKYDIPLDFQTSAKFDELYNAMLTNYGKSLTSQITTLTAGGNIDIDDIRKAATDPNFNKVLETLSNEGMPEFSNYRPRPGTMEQMVDDVQDWSTPAKLAAAGALLVGGKKAVLPAAKYGFGKVFGTTTMGARQPVMEKVFAAEGRNIKEVQKNINKIMNKIGKSVHQWRGKNKSWKYNPKKYGNAHGGFNSREAWKAAKNRYDKKYKFIEKQIKDVYKRSKIVTPGWIDPGKTGKGLLNFGKGLAPWMAPYAGQMMGETLWGEDSWQAQAGRLSGTAYLGSKFLRPSSLKNVPGAISSVTKKAAQKGFGSFLKTKFAKSAAKKIGISGALAIADGPLPFGEALALLMNVGWTAWEVLDAYKEWQQWKNK